jgi:hypothetical protein
VKAGASFLLHLCNVAFGATRRPWLPLMSRRASKMTRRRDPWSNQGAVHDRREAVVPDERKDADKCEQMAPRLGHDLHGTTRAGRRWRIAPTARQSKILASRLEYGHSAGSFRDTFKPELRPRRPTTCARNCEFARHFLRRPILRHRELGATLGIARSKT